MRRSMICTFLFIPQTRFGSPAPAMISTAYENKQANSFNLKESKVLKP
jgi:hypothetical protein